MLSVLAFGSADNNQLITDFMPQEVSLYGIDDFAGGLVFEGVDLKVA